METLCSLQALAAAIPDGSVLAIPPDHCGTPIAATLALIRRSARDLHLVCVPQSGLQTELLVGAGAVREEIAETYPRYAARIAGAAP